MVGLLELLLDPLQFLPDLLLRLCFAVCYNVVNLLVQNVLSEVLVLDRVDWVSELVGYHSINHSKQPLLYSGHVVFDVSRDVDDLNLLLVVLWPLDLDILELLALLLVLILHIFLVIVLHFALYALQR